MKNNPYINLLKSVWYFGAPYRKNIIGFYLAFALGRVLLSLSPYAFGKAIDILQNFTPQKLNSLIWWLSLGVFLAFLFWLFHGPARIIERQVALKIQTAYRLNIYDEITKLPLKWHQEHHSGNIITRFSRAANALYRFSEGQFVYIEVLIKFLASLGFLIWISPIIGFLSLCSSLLVIFVIFWFDKKLIPLYDQENELDNHVGGVLYDYISNMTTLLTLRLGKLTHNNLFMRLMKIWPIFKKDCYLNELKWFSINMIISIFQSAILIGYIIYNLKINNTIMIGTVVMIFRYSSELAEVFYDLSRYYSELVHMATDINGMQPIIDDIKKLSHKPIGENLSLNWHTIEINDLLFSHGEKHKAILDNISFSINRSEKIALIGESGCGKSTLLNILSGLYIPNKVNLKIDDNIFDNLEPLKSITTLIPQDPEIFENTIEFNITLDLPTSEEEVGKALELSKFKPVLEKLSFGLKTDIREKGLNLSVGQKQRLAFARGLFAARFSSLILMDEPTSSVDLALEKSILSGVINAFPNSAILVSLHRLHLLPKFDRIIMLKNGRIVAFGNTQELLNKPGEVFDLWQTYTKK